MGTQGTGRKRSTKKERSTAEDDALNLIAREAEARLAAKRAARAEAREIRMKELERQQKELSDDDERMSVGSRGSVRVEDRDYLEKGSRAASALTAGTLTSLGGTSSRRGSCETAVTLDAETSLREIKDALAEVEEKYRKAMVSNAQLDNEKSNLMYQVDTLKDSLMELEEMLSESQRGYEDKVKELEREKHTHSVLQFQFSELKETLKQSEELLNEIRQLRMKQEGFVREISDLQETVEWKDKKIGALERQKEYTDAIRIERDELREEVVKLKDILKKHGILLGPDLNINGDIGVDADGSSGADPASQTATETTTPPTEGNSMLGSTEETQLRSRGEEELNQEELRETEQPKGIHLSSDNVAGVDALEAPREELTNGEAQTRLAEDSVEESDPRNNLKVDIIEHVITEAQGQDDCSPKIGECATSCEKNVSESDPGEAKNKSSSIDTQTDEDRDPCNVSVEQDDNQPVVEENKSEESDLQQTAGQDSTKESSPHDSVPAVADNRLQKEPENDEEAENDEAEETPSKSQSQGAAASGKKKRKKRKGKKKGRGNEDKNQQKKEEEDKEKHERTNQIEITTMEGVPATQQDGPVSEVLRESRMDQAENEVCLQQTEDVGKEAAAKPTEPLVHSETPQEPIMDHVTDDLDKQQASETDVLVVEAVEVTETFSNIEASEQIHVESEVDGQSEENCFQTETVEAAETTETFANNETLGESLMDQVTEEGKEEPILETDKVAVIEVEEPLMTETLSHTETRQEIGEERVLDEPEEVPSSETATAEEAVENTENDSHDETLEESSTDVRKDEPEEEQSLETADVEVKPSLSPAPQGELGSPDPIDNVTDVENGDGCDNAYPSSVDRADLLMTGDNSICSQTGTAAEEDASLIINELKSVNNEAEEMENPEDDPQALSADATDRSETSGASDSQDNTSLSVSTNDGLSDGLGCLSGSEAPSELSDAPQTETSTDVTEPGTKTESSSDSQDGESSELEPGRAEKEEALGDEGLVEPHSSPPGEREDTPTSTIKTDVLDGVKSPELAAGLDDVESQTLQGDDHTDDSAAEEAPESEGTTTIDALETPHEAAEAGCSVEPESEELEDEHGETLLCPLEEQQRETSEGKSEDSPTDLQDSEEDEEDDEGQSFDFDDMDVELAVATNPVEAQLEETEEGVEVPSDESSARGSEQSNSEPNENTQKELVENDDKEALDVVERVEAAATSDGSASVGNVRENPKEAPEEGEGQGEGEEEEDAVVPEQPVAEEGELFVVGESGGNTENVDPSETLPVEEGLDAMKQEFQGDQAAGKEPQQMRKDAKKNSKKGKAKGKEDCKMS